VTTEGVKLSLGGILGVSGTSIAANAAGIAVALRSAIAAVAGVGSRASVTILSVTTTSTFEGGGPANVTTTDLTATTAGNVARRRLVSQSEACVADAKGALARAPRILQGCLRAIDAHRTQLVAVARLQNRERVATGRSNVEDGHPLS
jgi:hypothetical protein